VNLFPKLQPCWKQSIIENISGISGDSVPAPSSPMARIYENSWNTLITMRTGGKVLTFRSEKMLWGGKHTILIKRSDKLKEGQIRGFLRDINKKTSALEDLKEKLTLPKAKKRKKDKLEK